MLNLIKNEYIKVLKKKSTLVCVILLIIATIGMQGIVKLETVMMNQMIEDEDVTSIESRISMAQEAYDVTKSAVDKEDIDFWKLVNDTVDGDDDKLKIQILTNVRNQYNMNDTADEGVSSMDKVKDVASKIKGKSVDECLDVAIGVTEDKTYNSKDIKDPIVNQYKFLKDAGITEADDWRIEKVSLLMETQNYIEDNAVAVKDGLSKEIESMEKAKYALVNNVEHTVLDDTYEMIESGDDYWTILMATKGILSVLSIVMIVIAGGIVASEFGAGTIKFLLINPVKRGKIIISKYAMVLSFSAIMVVAVYILNVLVAFIFGGFGTVDAQYISYADGVATGVSAYFYLMKEYAVSYLGTLLYATMAFALSSLFRSTALSIGAGIGCMAFGSIAVNMLAMFNQDWGRYLLFANTDLPSIAKGSGLFPGMTIGFSAAVLVAHFVVFILAAYDGFVKREV